MFEFEFDSDFYLKENPDLILADINTHKKALTHWEIHGKNEGRFCSLEHKKYKEEQLIKLSLENKFENPKVGFIFTSHVNSEKTNTYWIECYNCIRKFYPENIIMIIRDKCNKEFLKTPEDLNMTNCHIIESEFPGAGELLPYYYFNKTKLFDIAVIMHDSVFLQKELPINFEEIITVKYLWNFRHGSENVEIEKKLINSLNNLEELMEVYNARKWIGCFGVQSVINIKFLENIVEKYNLFNLFNIVNNRISRCCLERVFAVICKNEDFKVNSIFGNIYDYHDHRYTYDQYLKNKLTDHHHLIKIRTGR